MPNQSLHTNVANDGKCVKLFWFGNSKCRPYRGVCVQGSAQQQLAQTSRQHAVYSPAARQLVQRVQSPHSSQQVFT